MSLYNSTIPFTDVSGGTYWVLTITAGNAINPSSGASDKDRTVKIKATSITTNDTRIIVADLRRGLFPFTGAEVGGGGITVNNTATIDSYSSTLGAYGKPNTTYTNYCWWASSSSKLANQYTAPGNYNWGYMGNVYSPSGGINVSNSTIVYGSVLVNGAVTMGNTMTVYGDAQANGDITLQNTAKILKPNNNTQSYFYSLVDGTKFTKNGEAHPGISKTCTCVAANVPSQLILANSSLIFKSPSMPNSFSPPTSGTALDTGGYTNNYLSVTLTAGDTNTHYGTVAINGTNTHEGALVLNAPFGGAAAEFWCNQLNYNTSKSSSGSAHLIINGNVNLYCNSFQMCDKGTVEITQSTGGQLSLFVTQSFNSTAHQVFINSNSVYNNAKNYDYNAVSTAVNPNDSTATFWMYSLKDDTGGSTDSIQFDTGSLVHGVVYAPKARVFCGQTTEYWGSIVSYYVDNGNSFNMHFDESLVNTALPILTTVQSPVTIMAWEQIGEARTNASAP